MGSGPWTGMRRGCALRHTSIALKRQAVHRPVVRGAANGLALRVHRNLIDLRVIVRRGTQDDGGVTQHNACGHATRTAPNATARASGPELRRLLHSAAPWPTGSTRNQEFPGQSRGITGPRPAMHWKGGRPPPPPGGRPSLRPATVPLTPSASLNGICNRQ